VECGGTPLAMLLDRKKAAALEAKSSSGVKAALENRLNREPPFRL
jgi:hypothetical protein